MEFCQGSTCKRKWNPGRSSLYSEVVACLVASWFFSSSAVVQCIGCSGYNYVPELALMRGGRGVGFPSFFLLTYLFSVLGAAFALLFSRMVPSSHELVTCLSNFEVCFSGLFL